jgi:AcrR family transcriptional regulator
MPNPPVDPRIERTKTVVLQAAFAVIGELGFGGATIDAIAQHSGVARSTIYRHWPDRDDLLIESMAHMVGTVESVTTGNLHDDLVALALQIGTVLATEPIGSVVASIITESRRDENLDQLRARFVEHRKREGSALVAAAVERGELPDTTDPLEVAEDLAARVFFQALILREPIDLPWAERYVDGLLARYSSVGGSDA